VSSARLFFVGGLLSYRALFGWLSPWILIPTYVVAPIFQILLFVYIGRSAGVQVRRVLRNRQRAPVRSDPVRVRDDEHDRRRARPEHAGAVLATPARRIPLFLGRSLPVIVNGFFVASFAFVVGGRIVGISVPASAVQASRSSSSSPPSPAPASA
jgi:ABC-2 type transport system permease protein